MDRICWKKYHRLEINGLGRELLGKFKVTRYIHERKRGATNNRDKEAFNNVIGGLGLIEVPLNDRRYT